MDEESNDLPEDLRLQFLTFLREKNDGEWEVVDKLGFVKFIVEHGKQYPVLYTLINIDKDAVVDHYERTGEVPPGVKLVRKTRESETVTRLEVLRGPIPPKSE